MGTGGQGGHGPCPTGCCQPPPGVPSPTHLARAPSGSAKSTAAPGPSTFSRWELSSCCFSTSTCLASAMGVSSSSAPDSFTELWGHTQGSVTPGTQPGTGGSSPGAGGAHLDLLHIPEQLLHLVLQPLESLLRRLLGTKTLTQLWEKRVRGLTGGQGSRGGSGVSWGVSDLSEFRGLTQIQGAHRCWQHLAPSRSSR